MRLRIAALALLLVQAAAQTQAHRPGSNQAGAEAAPPAVQYPPALMANLKALRDAALADDFAYRQVAHLTENIGPRSDGSPQAQAAVEYVAGELRKLGLEVRLEEVKVPHWIRGPESAELVEYPGQASGATQKVVVTALGGNTPTPSEGLTAEVVAVDGFDGLAALGRDKVSGKIVLFNVVFDERKAMAGLWGDAYGEAVRYRGDGAKRAAQLGAVASLVRSVGGANYRIPHTGWNDPAGIPAGAVSAEDADLIAHLTSQGKVRLHLVLSAHDEGETTSYNVVGDLKGSEHPEQVVVVSGHLDSWDLGTGAIDDAAGVAVAMETAKLVRQLKLQPRRTIRVIAWMDEENGGRGHLAYKAAHDADFPNHVAVIESDLGAAHPLGFNAKVIAAALPWLGPVQEVLRPVGANAVRTVSNSPGSDITPMAEANVPAFGIIQDGRFYFNYHHTPADTLDKIVPHELQENAAAIAVMGYALADMPSPLPR